jgi:hypothetical protein
MRKGYLLTGNCSHPRCRKRSILAEKLPLAGNAWWERCAEHATAVITLSAETLGKLGHEEGEREP